MPSTPLNKNLLGCNDTLTGGDGDDDDDDGDDDDHYQMMRSGIIYCNVLLR